MPLKRRLHAKQIAIFQRRVDKIKTNRECREVFFKRTLIRTEQYVSEWCCPNRNRVITRLLGMGKRLKAPMIRIVTRFTIELRWGDWQKKWLVKDGSGSGGTGRRTFVTLAKRLKSISIELTLRSTSLPAILYSEFRVEKCQL